jgi:superfamily II DNA or RNA helicase
MGAGTLTPTAEQQAVIDACGRGGNVVVEAAAGAGKTSTLRAAAGSLSGRVLYLAYNKAAAELAGAGEPR